MVEVRRLTTEEVKARLAELDEQHPTWAAIYRDVDDWMAHPDVWFHPDAWNYGSWVFRLGDAE